MKPRLFPILALLTLMGLSLAGAVTAEPAAPPVDASSSTASFLCSLSMPASAPEVAGWNPAPVLKAGTLCGPCSFPCRNVTVGTGCTVGEHRGTCQPFNGYTCSDASIMCTCQIGPLP